MKKIKLLMLISIFVFIPIGVKAISATTEEQIEAVMKTAEAYYRQGSQIQYDSYKKNLSATPEDATSQHFSYTVCSGFTYQVYYQALGIEIPDTTEGLLDYAQANKDKLENILYYYEYDDTNSDYTSSIAFSDFIENKIDEIKPGDIFVVTGHSMMVESVDVTNKKIVMIEGRGDRYNYGTHVDAYDKNGAIGYNTISEISDNKQRFALIRIITDGVHYINTENQSATYDGITLSAKSRLNYPQIDIEKTVKISNDSKTVSQNVLTNIGDSITYEITIKNNSTSDYSSFEVIENIDSNLVVTDQGNGILSENKLKWTIPSLASGQSIKIGYTVEVPVDKSLYGKIIVSTGSVDNIATSKIETLIGNTLTQDEKINILNSFNKLKSDSKIEREFINEVYLDSLNLDLGLSNLNNLDIMSLDLNVTNSGTDILSIVYTKLNDTSVKKYVYNNFYGLRLSEKTNSSQSLVRAFSQWNYYPTFELNDRARTLTSDMLDDGDIILVYTGDTGTTDTNLVNKSYIYLSNTLFRKTASNTFEKITGDELTVFLRNIVGDNYVILRPSIALVNNDDNDDTGNEKIPDTGTEDDDEGSEEIKNPDTGVYFRYGMLLLAILISVTVYLLIRKKSLFIRHD